MHLILEQVQKVALTTFLILEIYMLMFKTIVFYLFRIVQLSGALTYYMTTLPKVALLHKLAIHFDKKVL